MNKKKTIAYSIFIIKINKKIFEINAGCNEQKKEEYKNSFDKNS